MLARPCGRGALGDTGCRKSGGRSVAAACRRAHVAATDLARDSANCSSRSDPTWTAPPHPRRRHRLRRGVRTGAMGLLCPISAGRSGGRGCVSCASCAGGRRTSARTTLCAHPRSFARGWRRQCCTRCGRRRRRVSRSPLVGQAQRLCGRGRRLSGRCGRRSGRCCRLGRRTLCNQWRTDRVWTTCTDSRVTCPSPHMFPTAGLGVHSFTRLDHSVELSPPSVFPATRLSPAVDLSPSAQPYPSRFPASAGFSTPLTPSPSRFFSSAGLSLPRFGPSQAPSPRSGPSPAESALPNHLPPRWGSPRPPYGEVLHPEATQNGRPSPRLPDDSHRQEAARANGPPPQRPQPQWQPRDWRLLEQLQRPLSPSPAGPVTPPWARLRYGDNRATTPPRPQAAAGPQPPTSPPPEPPAARAVRPPLEAAAGRSPTPPPHQETPNPSTSVEPSSTFHETGQVRRTRTVRTNFVGSLLAKPANSAAAPPSAADEEAALSAQWRQQ